MWQEALNGKPPEKRKARVKPSDKPVIVQVKASAPVKAMPLPLIEKATYIRIRRGAIRIDATLDLHGLSREEAYTALLRFVEAAQARGARTLLIITGKGKGGGGTLREWLPRWLGETPLRGRIIAYDSAGPRHGGAGAWYIRIRRG